MYQTMLVQYHKRIGKVVPNPKRPFDNENLGIMVVYAKDRDDAFAQVRKQGRYPFAVILQ